MFKIPLDKRGKPCIMLRATGYGLRATGYGLRATGYVSPVVCASNFLETGNYFGGLPVRGFADFVCAIGRFRKNFCD